MKNDRHLRDFIDVANKKSAIGVFVCLFAIFGTLNYGFVSQFITWVISFFVGGIFSFFVYIIIFLLGIYLIFNRNQKKINFDITIFGLIFIFLGVIIIVSNSFYYIDSENYLRFDSEFSQNFMSSISIDQTFPLVDYSKNCGLIGVILTAIINSAMTYIGSYVIGSILLCVGFVLTCTKLFIRFTKVISDYRNRVLSTSSKANYQQASDAFNGTEEIKDESRVISEPKLAMDSSDLDSQENVSEINVGESTHQKVTNNEPTNVYQPSQNTNVNTNYNPNRSNNPVYNEPLYKDKPVYSSQSDMDSGLRKAIFDNPLFNNQPKHDSYQENYVNRSYQEEPRPVYQNSQNVNPYQNQNISTNNYQNDIETPISQNIVEEPVIESTPIPQQQISSSYQRTSKVHYVEQPIEPTQIKENGESIIMKAFNTTGEGEYYEVKPEITPVISREPLRQKVEPKVNTNDIVSSVRNYQFPPSDLLLVRENSKNDDINKKTAEERIEIINKLCRDFNFGGHIESYQIGPSVTRYDLKVNESTQVTKFVNLVEDLSVRLGGFKARFEAVVPGKRTSGIEVQNEKSNIVDFRDVFEHLPPINEKKYNGLLIPFGKDISGNYITADLREFPHVLICGTTGSGKSVFMQTMIMTIIMRNSPEDVRLFIIDPKRVEFSKYREIPHLLGPICTEPHQAYNGLNQLVEIMERRYKVFEDTEVTDIKEYNRDYAPTHKLKKMPYIVAVIDEYSNLVDGCKKVSEPVLSIAQKARACGIHLIIATQAPRTSIITGVIKANLPTRVALLCANTTDSQNVIDIGGAERLLGNGDMLIKSPLISTVGCARVQGAFVEGKEIKNVVDFIKARYGCDYVTEFTNLSAASSEPQQVPGDIHGQMAKAQDALYEEVKSLAMSMDYFSISKITRVFNVGFARAGKLFEMLKKDGIIEANQQGNDSKGTRVLVHSNTYSTGETVLSGEDTKLSNIENPDI